MKYAVVIPDGCADEPQAELGGLTPLQAARTPAFDELARRGRVGRANNVPPGFPSGSDVATMSLFGYDPVTLHTGRAPLEAAAQGIPLGPEDWAIRCNLVNVRQGLMHSFTAGQIPTPLAHRLIRLLQQGLGGRGWEFHPGVSYRNLAVFRGAGQTCPFTPDTHTTPPHDLTGQPIEPGLPRGPGSGLLRQLMSASERLLATDAENLSRPTPATQAWFWGQGRRPSLKPFAERFGIQGAMITAVDLLRGLAVLLGWRIIEVEGATGYLDTNYAGKGQAAIEALATHDLVVVHVEATDEASHEGDARAKVAALERIDAEIVGPLWRHLAQLPAARLLISPDHPTFLRTKTHSHGFVPFVVAGTGITPDSASLYDESSAASSMLVFPEGHLLMPWFLAPQIM